MFLSGAILMHDMGAGFCRHLGEWTLASFAVTCSKTMCTQVFLSSVSCSLFGFFFECIQRPLNSCYRKSKMVLMTRNFMRRRDVLWWVISSEEFKRVSFHSCEPRSWTLSWKLLDLCCFPAEGPEASAAVRASPCWEVTGEAPGVTVRV